jgi:hypothetical protein
VVVLALDGEIIISNNTFLSNYATYGGTIYLGPKTLGGQAVLSQNLFHSNSALQGGAINILFNKVSPILVDNQFVNNTAVLYGHTFAGVGHFMRLLVPQSSNTGQSQSTETATIQLFSGDVFPTVKVFLEDVFFNRIVPSAVLVDLLVASATVVSARNSTLTPKAAAVVGFEEAMLQDEDSATFTSLQIVGLAGEYTLLIVPKINFDPERMNAALHFTLKECGWPKFQQHVKNEPFPRCVASMSDSCVL